MSMPSRRWLLYYFQARLRPVDGTTHISNMIFFRYNILKMFDLPIYYVFQKAKPSEIDD